MGKRSHLNPVRIILLVLLCLPLGFAESRGLSDGGTLEVVVVDVAGEPVPYANLWWELIRGEPGEVYTLQCYVCGVDADGTGDFGQPPGLYSIEAVGYATYSPDPSNPIPLVSNKSMVLIERGKVSRIRLVIPEHVRNILPGENPQDH